MLRFRSQAWLSLAAVAVVGVAGCQSKTNPPVEVGVWGAAEVVDVEDNGDVVAVTAVVDAIGNYTAVWTQDDGTRINQWARRFRRANGWTDAELIDDENLGDAEVARLVVDSAGDVTAVWRQSDGTTQNLWACRYTFGIGWDAAEEIDTTDDGDVEAPNLLLDGNENVVVVWRQSDGVRFDLWSARYRLGIGWTTAERIDSEDLGDVDSTQLVGDGAGNLFAVWRQDDGLRYNQWSNRYTNGAGWGVPIRIELENLGDVGTATVHADMSGNVYAVWPQHDGARDNLTYNRYVFGVGWGPPTRVENMDDGSASDPRVADALNDSVVVVWRQSDGAQVDLYASRFSGGAFAVPELVDSEDLGSVLDHRITADVAGRVVAVWLQDDGTTNNLWGSRYVVGAGWSTATKLETDDAGDAFIASGLLAGPDGSTVIIWHQDDGLQRNQMACRLSAAGSFSAAELIDSEDLGDVRSALTGIDSSGFVTAVWRQHDGSRFNQWANRYQPDTGWREAELIDAENSGDVDPAVLVIDFGGRALAIWRQANTSRYNLWSNRIE
ncbi:MAG: hypothetical protein ACKVX7_11720 [Planctomycetota bacterium]